MACSRYHLMLELCSLRCVNLHTYRPLCTIICCCAVSDHSPSPNPSIPSHPRLLRQRKRFQISTLQVQNCPGISLNTRSPYAFSQGSAVVVVVLLSTKHCPLEVPAQTLLLPHLIMLPLPRINPSMHRPRNPQAHRNRHPRQHHRQRQLHPKSLPFIQPTPQIPHGNYTPPATA